MSRVIITANKSGFYNLSPLGAAIAPNVFLKTATNIEGIINTISAGWESLESGMYEDFGVAVIAEPINMADPALGMRTELVVTQLEFYRIENGVRIVTGTLTLPEPLVISATYDELNPGEFGWRADLGDSLEDIIQTEGFVFRGDDGDDVFAAHTNIGPIYERNTINGEGGDDHLTGSLGNDIIRGGSGDDVIIDPDGVNELRGGSGDDLIEIGDGSDGSTAWGGNGNDVIISGKGNDHLIGNAGRDKLIGGRGDDILEGKLATDTLDGGRGEDVIIGGSGSDMLTGGEDADQFVFYADDRGHDIITDFSDGEDIIVLHGLIGMDDLDIMQVGSDVLVAWGSDDSQILVENMDVADLTGDDFLFM